MYKERRPVAQPFAASTPEVWADILASPAGLNPYRRVAFRVDHRWRLIRRFVPAGGRILDAGCGTGEWVAFLNEMGYRAEGVDYSSNLIERARAAYPRLRWTVGPIQGLPYESASF